MQYSVLGVISALLLIVFPFITTTELFYGTVNAKALAVIFTADVAILIGAYTLYRTETFVWKHRWFSYALLTTLGALTLSAYLGVYFERSLWSDILRSTGVIFLAHVGVYSLILGATFRDADWTLLRRSLAFSTGIFALLSIAGAEGFGFDGKFLGLDLSVHGLTLGNTTFAGAYLLLAFGLTLVELLRSFGVKKWRYMLLATLVLTGLSPVLFNTKVLIGQVSLSTLAQNPELLLGSARASSATMFLLVLFVLGWVGLRRMVPNRFSIIAVSAWSISILVGIVAAVTLLFVPGSVVQNAYIESSTAARIIVWESGFEAFRERPVFGWGPENFNDGFERHFDNRLFLAENFGEVWFDRAHNVIVDTLVTTGVVGMGATFLLVGVYVLVIYRARRKGLVGDVEAAVLIALVPAHFLQLQTGFDTVGSYLLLGVIAGYAVWLECRLGKNDGVVLDFRIRTMGAGVLGLIALASLSFVFWGELQRQAALMNVFQTGDTEEQHQNLRIALARTSDFEGLRLASSSFIKGALAGVAEARERQSYVQSVLSSMTVYEERYEAYLAVHPDYYRARMNYAYLLLLQTTLGNNRLTEVDAILADSHHLSPENPITYALDATAGLYSRDFDRAGDSIDAAVALNPGAPFTKEMYMYIVNQVFKFPNITVLKLENL